MKERHEEIMALAADTLDRCQYHNVATALRGVLAELAETSDKQEAVAKVRVTSGGYGMVLHTYVAYALPEGIHDLYAHPIASAEQDRINALEEALRIALEFIDDAQITDGQWHWLDEVRPVLSKGASK